MKRKPVERGDSATLASQVYERIKRDIVTHRLRPGERVSESALAASHKTSKAPVRVALARLQQEHLIVQAAPKTQIVAPLTLKGVRDIFDLRNLLEPEAVRLATGRVSLTRLRELNEACAKPIRAGNADDEFRLLAANRAFHLELASASGNDLLADWIGRLHDLAIRIMWLALRSETTSEAWSEGHDELIVAIEKSDAEAAKSILLRLLRDGQRQVYERLMNLPGLSELNLQSPVWNSKKIEKYDIDLLKI
ncbi:GntR family transcriptional regulator [Bradyrhizobium prioriisuperbiae]|uniref:GntR family transcriptional regulator n=1 Tax=Bradyrhizobium prioriisuperbiae TaxID=2854389 RepID=UPI0028EB201C|nr:GntR family transcriptional regulator [Bradyrhizobium prioritasuperba]